MIVMSPYDKVSLEEFLPDLTYDMPKLDEDAAMHFLRRAMIRLARESNAIRRKAVIHTQECVDNYRLLPPDCVDIVAIMNVCNISGSNCGDVTRLTHTPCRVSMCGVVSWFEEPNTIFFSPGRTGQVYEVDFSVSPKIDDCEVDRDFLTKHYEVVLSGAKAIAYNLTDKPWSNASASQAHKLDFEMGIRVTAMDKLMGNQRGSIRAKRAKVL